MKRERVVIDIEQGNVRYLANPEIAERSGKEYLDQQRSNSWRKSKVNVSGISMNFCFTSRDSQVSGSNMNSCLKSRDSQMSCSNVNSCLKSRDSQMSCSNMNSCLKSHDADSILSKGNNFSFRPDIHTTSGIHWVITGDKTLAAWNESLSSLSVEWMKSWHFASNPLYGGRNLHSL